MINRRLWKKINGKFVQSGNYEHYLKWCSGIPWKGKYSQSKFLTIFKPEEVTVLTNLMRMCEEDDTIHFKMQFWPMTAIEIKDLQKSTNLPIKQLVKIIKTLSRDKVILLNESHYRITNDSDPIVLLIRYQAITQLLYYVEFECGTRFDI